ncbi:MAG: hypothetical protein ABIB11_04135, partial [Candidatus Omnitrophota bacterium]
VLCSLIFVLCSEATFYEVRGKISWENKVYSQVDAYLLYDKLTEYNSEQATEISKGSPQRSFDEEYASLEKKSMIGTDNVSDKKEMKKTQKELRHGLEGLIKQYRARSVSINRKGEFYLNVSPDISYYILVLKKDALFAGDNHTRFWLYRIYFKPGDVLDAKEIIFNETNVMTW